MAFANANDSQLSVLRTPPDASSGFPRASLPSSLDLREGIAHCEGVRDYVSRDLLRRILDNEEEHVDFLERQFDLIKQIGIERHILLNSAAAPDQKPE
jgi:hypothetical protein